MRKLFVLLVILTAALAGFAAWLSHNPSTAEAGEALGLSAAISGVSYEVTAETATPCQLNFVDRKNLLELLQSQPELGAHATRCLSRDFQSAYRDIRDLIIA